MEKPIAKIAVSIHADKTLDRILNKINDGFTGGRISKTSLTSWIILYFEEQCLQACLEKVRKDHFDPAVYLEAVSKEIKNARKSGAAEIDVAALLSPLTSQLKSISVQKKLRSEKDTPTK